MFVIEQYFFRFFFGKSVEFPLQKNSGTMYHPSRGGVRGGQDQFDWEDVKADKYRESYLGELKH